MPLLPLLQDNLILSRPLDLKSVSPTKSTTFHIPEGRVLVILLMAEIPNNHLRYMKPYTEWDKLPTSTGVGFNPVEKYSSKKVHPPPLLGVKTQTYSKLPPTRYTRGLCSVFRSSSWWFQPP